MFINRRYINNWFHISNNESQEQRIIIFKVLREKKKKMEKGVTTHSSILAWRIRWTEEPGGLQAMGLQRVGHDWATDTYTRENNCLPRTKTL